MDYIDTWKSVMQSPSEFYRKMPKTGGYADPLIFAAINFVVFGLMTALFNRGMYGGIYGGREFGFFIVFGSLIMTPIFGIIFIFIEALILYVIYRLLGGSGTYEGTVRFISYATAVLLLSWIPFIGWLVGFYGIYLYIVGGMYVHDVGMAKSIIAVILPTILFILLVILIGAVAFSQLFI
jgi:hypothetical protein